MTRRPPIAVPVVRANSATSVRVSIGALALSGLSSSEARRLSGAFESELGKVLRRGTLPSEGHTLERLQLPRLVLRAGQSAEQTGRSLACLIAKQLDP